MRQGNNAAPEKEFAQLYRLGEGKVSYYLAQQDRRGTQKKANAWLAMRASANAEEALRRANRTARIAIAVGAVATIVAAVLAAVIAVMWGK